MANGPDWVLQSAYTNIKPSVLYVSVNDSDPGKTGAGECAVNRVAVSLPAGSAGVGTAVAVDVPVVAGKTVTHYSVWNHLTQNATTNFVIGDKILPSGNMAYSANGFVRVTLTIGFEYKP